MKYAGGSCALKTLNDRSSSVCIAEISGDGLPTGGVSGGPASVAAGAKIAASAPASAGASKAAEKRFKLRKGVLTIRFGCTS